jgi:uncharacterized protein YndB with AHSA1/START domain
MNAPIAIAPVRKSVRVTAPVARAFDVFTGGLSRWWPLDHGVGKKPIARVMIEPRRGGRWLEIAEDGTQTSVATITLWEPPHRLVMVWRINAQWKPDMAMKSEVDVRFTADGPNATLVEAASQVRNHGCGGRCLDAQRCRSRLARADRALCARS